jgi:hypothetical protein
MAEEVAAATSAVIGTVYYIEFVGERFFEYNGRSYLDELVCLG